MRTLLGRFFEHSRFFIFEAGGESTFLLGSADLMPRNLDHRIEILVPVEDARGQRELTANVRLDHGGHPAGRGRCAPTAPGRGCAGRRASAGQSLHGSLMRRARARARRRTSPSHAPADCPTDALGRMERVRVAIVDVGANTLRLLVAVPDGSACRCPCTRSASSSGSGRRSSATATSARRSVAEAVAGRAREQTRKARQLGCERIEIVVTSPGRQSANSDEFADALARATGVPVRILSGRGGRGARLGRRAVAALDDPPESVAVCDVGGGSAQLVVGTLETGARLDRARSISARCGSRTRLLDRRSALTGSGRGGAGGGRRGVRLGGASARARSGSRPGAPRVPCGASSGRSTRRRSRPRSRSCRS